MNSPHGFSVSYQTKIVDVKSVNLVGKLNLNLGGYEESAYWEIIDSNGTRRQLEEWLDKFEGRNVRILIEAFGDDDTALLEGEQVAPDEADWPFDKLRTQQVANRMARQAG